MSFFIRGKNFTTEKKNSRQPNSTHSERKGKRKKGSSSNHKNPKKRAVVSGGNVLPQKDDEIDSDDMELDEITNLNRTAEVESEDDQETAQDKKVRLAKLYLDEIEKEERQRLEAEDVDKSVIAHRLKEDYLEQTGKLRKTVADTYSGYGSENTQILRCKEHKLAITCLVVSADNQFMFSASKDSGIVKWSVSERKKLNSIPRDRADGASGHTKTILCLAISTDSRFLASGGDDKVIHIWNPGTLEHVHVFKQHTAPVTGLAFRRNTHQLFSVSADKCVKIFSLDEMTYVETMFGHETGITSVDVLSRERAITSGGWDHTIRIWKVVEESQLIYNGHTGSIEMVRLVNEEHFVSCGDDGLLCLWGTMKKKPLCTVNSAHGTSEENQEPNWISSIAALVNTDLVASGSQDGNIRLWKCGDNFRSLTQIMEIPVKGFVNSLAFTSDGNFLIAGVGQEHKLGRWFKVKDAKNGIFIVPLRKHKP